MIAPTASEVTVTPLSLVSLLAIFESGNLIKLECSQLITGPMIIDKNLWLLLIIIWVN